MCTFEDIRRSSRNRTSEVITILQYYMLISRKNNINKFSSPFFIHNASLPSIETTSRKPQHLKGRSQNLHLRYTDCLLSTGATHYKFQL